MEIKPYILRKSNGTIIGPCNSSEIQKLFESQDLSNRDEACASLGRWVFLKSDHNLKNTYPEIYQSIKAPQNLEWAESDHPTRIHRETSKWTYIAPVLAVIISVSSIGFWYINQPKEDQNTSELLKQAQKFQYQKRGFSLWFDDHKENILQESRNQDLQKIWLPFLRKYAFQNKGYIQGLNPNIIKGNPTAPAPTQCSKDHWIQRWKKKSKIWNQVMTEPPTQWPDWLLVLTWDPHWLRTHPQELWTYPTSYMSGCLIMAKKGLDELLENPRFVNKFLGESSKTRSAMTWISARLQWQNNFIITKNPPDHQPSQQLMGPSWCVETVNDFDFEHCRTLKNMNEYEEKSFKIKKMAQIIRNITLDSSFIEIEKIKNNLESTGTYEDPINGFNYSAEFRLIDLYIKTESKIPLIKSRFQSEYPNVHFFE